MTVLGNSYLQLVDLYKRTDATRDIAMVVEALSVLNPLMEDAHVMECNQGTKHLHTIRTGLPAVAWGSLYSGIPQAKSTTQQVEDTTGFVEGLSTVDKRLLDISKNPAALRMSEAQAFLESMSQEVQSAFFYADTATSPKKYKGLAARYNALPTAGSPASNQVVNAGGVGSDNTSIWFVTWGPGQTSFLTPEGIPAGIKREDKGEQRVLDASNNPYYVKEELFTQHVGLSVKDWRFNARICNIDVSLAQAGSVDLYKFMRNAYYKLQVRRNRKMPADAMVAPGKTVCYMNRDMLEVLDALATNKGSADNFVRLQRREVEGEEITFYRNIPIRETDALLNTETLVA